MTPSALTRARHALGLNLEQMALMLGYEGLQIRSQMHSLESGRRTIRPAQRRLIDAYLAGYRPEDWPLSEADELVRRIANPSDPASRFDGITYSQPRASLTLEPSDPIT